MIEYGIIAFLLALGYFVGSWAESRHYREIEKNEERLNTLPATNLKNHPELENAERTWLVTESVVIGQDYFKRFVAALINIVGGRVSSYETLVDRARREAIIRLKDQAKDADLIVNIRLETSSIGGSANRKGTVGSIEALAYGTAVKLRK
ncbi:MAG: heavy metal-binding domain-containing protein [Bdellovibrionales bacterium]|nr:heavy metal-binding domain-containing protein [Bdellovibrionales bacterium]